jgi:hypothetical protein
MLKHLFISATFLLSAILPAAAVSIGEIGFFGNVNNNASWSHFITLASVDEADSGEEQTLNISVTSLPDGGANYRIVKTVRNGNFDAGNSKALKIGSNPITVPAVSYLRVVKIQFSSGEIEYDSLVVNGSELSLDTSGVSVSPDNSYLFEEADNDDWPLVTTLTTISDGLSSQGEQTFEMYVTSLPTQVANLRVYKTTSSGSDYFGEPQQIKLGPNTVTVAGVAFDRTVKIQLSSSAEDIQFNALSVNSSQLYPGPPVISLNGASSITLTVGDTYEELGASAVDDIGNPVEVISDANSVVDTNTAGTYTVTYSVDTAESPIIITRTVVVEDSVRDTLPPVITLSGDSSITLTVGDAYEELGAIATDATDGDVEVIISGEVNTSSIGTYTITYTATDAADNSDSVTRTVTIEEADADGDGVADSIDVHPGFDDTGLSTYLETWLTENSYVSTSAITDFRAGSTSVAVSGGVATIDLEMEQSDDLEAWTPTGESATVNVTVSEDTRFYRIKLVE